MGLESLRNFVTVLAAVAAAAARPAELLFAGPMTRKQYHGRQLLLNNNADKATTSKLTLTPKTFQTPSIESGLASVSSFARCCI